MSNRFLHSVFALALFMVLASFVGIAASQSPRAAKHVRDLNSEAMEQYNDLEIEKALSTLKRALAAAQKAGLSGRPVAQTHVNMGVIFVGGMGDNANGMEAFVAALEADPDIKLDPFTSTPEVKQVFALAKQRAGGGASSRPEGNIPHEPVTEQRSDTPIPVYVATPSDAPVRRVALYYRGPNMEDYKKVRMDRTDDGFVYEIPCEVVRAPQVDYYVVAYGRRKKAIGYSGTRNSPITVTVVEQLLGPAPSLPGREPPSSCSETECPPGMPGCVDDSKVGALAGEYCSVTDDCDAGLDCVDNVCQWDDGGGKAPRAFLHAGGTLGFAYVSEGMPADGPPVGSGMSTTRLPGTMEGCDPPDGDGDYCVAISSPGFVPTFALRLTGGYYFTERLGAGFTWRMQPNAGQGTLANMLFGLRVLLRVTEPRETGLDLATFLGTSYGQIQPQPDQPSSSDEPFVRTGLNGVQAGGVVVYRFTKYIGMHFTPEIHVMLPLFLFNVDLTAGLALSF